MKIIRLTLLIGLTLTARTASHAQNQTAPLSPAPEQNAAQSKANAASPNVAEAVRLNRQVVELYQAGKHGEAVPLAERVVMLREQAQGKDHIEVAVALNNLAMLYAELNKNDRARALYERALAIREAQPMPDEKSANRLREILGTLYYRKGDYDKAEAMFSRLLSGREKLYGSNDEEVTLALVNLAYVYMAKGNPQKINATYSRILDHTDQMKGPLPKRIDRAFNDLRCLGPSSGIGREERDALLKRINEVPDVADDAFIGRAIRGGVLNGKAISKPQPAYPAEAKQARVQGTVTVKITVDETGKVVKAEPLCGPLLLQQASVQSAYGWRFSPTLLSGQPVKVTGTVTFNFRLQ
ncbi:MAG: TonB family protein [Pyrinomonadaceae bacterium]